MKKHIVRSKAHRLSQFLYSLSLVFLGIGLFSLGWAVWPVPMDGIRFTIPAGALPGAPGEDEYQSLSEYSLEVNWPRWVRKGEPGAVQLHLTDLDPASLTELDPAQVVLVEPAFYPLQTDPPGEIQANLGDDQTLLLSWSVTGDQRGAYQGKLYVSFGFFDADEGALTAVPVAVVDLDIQVIELWGLRPGIVIWFGFVCLALWGALFLLGNMAGHK